MKKIGRIYGEAKISVREAIGNRENTTEPPAIKRLTKNIDDVNQYLKEVYKRMSKQSKTNLLSIEESELVGTAFDEYGVRLREEGDFGQLGDVFVTLASFHQSIEALRLQMDTALQTKVATPFHDFVKNEVRRARYEKVKYDKARVSFDALHNKAKQMKKKGSIDKVVEVERELEDYKIQFEEIALETVKVQSDVCDMHEFQTFERMCDYISIYEDFFAQGLHLAKQISKDLPSYRATIKELRDEFAAKKLQRGDVDDEPGPNMVFGVPLEELVERENPPNGIPAVVDQCIKYLYNNSLKAEGIFRVSGSQKEVQEIKKTIERGTIDFSGVTNDHNVSGILKLFFRELPTPLFTFNLYNPIIKSVQESGKDDAQCTSELRALLDTLPVINKNITRYLFGLCHQISAHSSENLMTSRNLAVVLAPNILYSPDVSLEAVADANGAVEYFISHYEMLFPGSFADLVNSPSSQPPSAGPTAARLSVNGPPHGAPPSLSSTSSNNHSRLVSAPPGTLVIPLTQNVPPTQSPLSSSAPAITRTIPAGNPRPLPAGSPNNKSIPAPAGKPEPLKRPPNVRGSMMFHANSMSAINHNNNDDDTTPLRKIAQDDFALLDEPIVSHASSRGLSTPVSITPHPPSHPAVHHQGPPPGHPAGHLVPPSQHPQQQTAHSPTHPSRPMPDPNARKSIMPGSGKQLPPPPQRPPGKPFPSPQPGLNSSGSLPPPPHSHPRQSVALSLQDLPPPPAPLTTPVLKPSSSPSHSLTPPPPLSTPPLKSLAPPPSLQTPPFKSPAFHLPPKQNEDLIQF